MSYKLGIIGSRVSTLRSGRVWNPKITNPRQFAFDELDKYVAKHGMPSKVISGGARGADEYGEAWAKARGIETQIFKPQQKLINMAGFKYAANARNTDIVNSSDRIVTFWDQKSRGTADTLAKAEKANKFIKSRDLFNVG